MADAVGFFTDTTLCIGCKACQVACHQWNDLKAGKGRVSLPMVHNVELPALSGNSSATAPCLEVCPTSAILRTEFDTVYINEPACNGCRDCVSACPFGVIHMADTGRAAQKCPFWCDRLQNGLHPACSQACPTQSIQFGKLDELQRKADRRLADLKSQGVA